MIYTGRDPDGDPLYMDFDSEDKDMFLSDRRQCGFVIDLAKIIE